MTGFICTRTYTRTPDGRLTIVGDDGKIYYWIPDGAASVEPGRRGN